LPGNDGRLPPPHALSRIRMSALKKIFRFMAVLRDASMKG
jgi:hypothetical protein